MKFYKKSLLYWRVALKYRTAREKHYIKVNDLANVKRFAALRLEAAKEIAHRLEQLSKLDHVVPGSTIGIPVVPCTSVNEEHPTEGLPGYPAHDYFAPAGSDAVAPWSGTIRRFSGHDPAQGPVEGAHGPFGWSIYLAADTGHDVYMTHFGSRTVAVGDRVQQGQKIGTVGDYAKWTGTPNHIHMGVH